MVPLKLFAVLPYVVTWKPWDNLSQFPNSVGSVPFRLHQGEREEKQANQVRETKLLYISRDEGRYHSTDLFLANSTFSSIRDSLPSCVGSVPNSMLDARRKVPVMPVSFPNSEGTVPVKLFLMRLNPETISFKLPSWEGIVPVRLFPWG